MQDYQGLQNYQSLHSLQDYQALQGYKSLQGYQNLHLQGYQGLLDQARRPKKVLLASQKLPRLTKFTTII